MPSISLCVFCTFQALVLLLIANGAPILVGNVMGTRWAKPIDNGITLPDGQRLLGDTKTWRGLCAAACLTALGAILFDLPVWLGVVFGVLSMLGDLLSSFIKRRHARIESSHAPGLDTMPESLLPIGCLQMPLNLGITEMAIIAGAFFLLEELVSPILFKLHIRSRPY